MESFQVPASMDADPLAALIAPPGGEQDEDAGGPVAPAPRRSVHSVALTSRAAELATATIMIVDDEPVNIKIAQKYLKLAGYQRFVFYTDPRMALESVSREPPDVLLLDLVMPDVNGFQILKAVRDHKDWMHIPVIVLTSSDDDGTRTQALEMGASDFLGKPVNATELLPRVRNALLLKAHYDHLQSLSLDLEEQVCERTAETVASRLDLTRCLTRAARYGDNETDRHMTRVGRYAAAIAWQLGLDPAAVELIEHAAPLHDMGKLGIPDAILLNPDRLTPDELDLVEKHGLAGQRAFEPLTPDEWQAYQAHTRIGEEILNVPGSTLLELAGQIALRHHEKWDGSGYPDALSGDAIPLPGRITAVADAFDALSTKQAFKPAFALDRCLEIMEESRGGHFDPAVLDAFLASRDEIIPIHVALADPV
jgi:putative two-component system response regulator